MYSFGLFLNQNSRFPQTVANLRIQTPLLQNVGATFGKMYGEKFKHEITAQFRGISLIWTLSLCARDVGRMWMSSTLL